MKQMATKGYDGLVQALAGFAGEPELYYAAESFLKDGLGIITRSNNPGQADNDYFKINDSNTQSVRKSLGGIRYIYPIGHISHDFLVPKKQEEADHQGCQGRYDRIYVFALEADENASITREDIATLTLSFNRINSATMERFNAHNRPVLVITRQGKKLSLSTCERIPKTENQDHIGNVIVLYNIDCENPRQGHLQILADMARCLKNSPSFDILFQNLLKSLSIDIVSENFFKGYTNLFKKIVKAATESSPISKEFRQFPDPSKAIRNYVKKLMGRIVFIQFLQRKGWMGVPADDEGWTTGDPEFIQNLFERYERKSAFVEEVLNPLFDDLNTKREGDLANVCIGKGIKIPYLNGGLFDKDEYDGIRFSLPEYLMREMLVFFRSYNFTIDENSQDSVEVGVDPEMLSRIFESLLEDNNATGSFYTPKEIVDYMCREALVAYLQADTKDETKRSQIREFVQGHNAEILDAETLDCVEHKLRSVKVCDPAIGSGAFPMGMLKELFDCRKVIEVFKNGSDSNLSDIKKDILQNSIYGVDIDKGAVDIARLRFWLALIIDEKTPHALPNMDFKIMQGNSLLERYEGVDLSKIELSQKKPRGKKKGLESQQSFDFDAGYALRNIQINIQEYYRTDSHDVKLELREEINRHVKEYICHLNECTPEVEKKIKALRIPNDQFFLWHIYFKEVFDQGGFDIVIGNPPYIELQKMGKMSEVYGKCGFDTYTKSADIYCLFTEHGFNLLKRGGTLCYIMMNKWMKAEYGQPLRKFLLSRKIHRIVDFGDVQVFKNATTYPCIILTGNSSPEVSFQACRLKEFDLNSVTDISDEFPTSELDDDVWVIPTRKDQLLFKKLVSSFPTLEDYLDIPAKYGIKPGLSEAFLISEETKNRIIEGDSMAEEIIVPFLSGKDIRPYEPPTFERYLILFKKGDTLRLMRRESATEEEAWSFIRSRYPSVCAWLGQFKKIAQKRSDKGDFWWELRACNYYDLFSKPKIMYQTFQVKPNFIYDTQTTFCNNSMWIIPTEDKALLGLLNSRIGWWLISDYCSQIQNGYQLIWDYFRRIPVALKKDGNEELSRLVDGVIDAKKAGDETKASVLRQQIDECLYELYDMTNGEVKVVDPNAQTFGADFEPFKRKPGFQMTPDEEIDRIYKELRKRFDAIASALDNAHTDIEARYDLSSSAQPSKEELIDAFFRWNCAILTAFRGSGKLNVEKKEYEENLEKNRRRNDELKDAMRDRKLLFRPVDGYYVEIQQGEKETIREKVNEFSFFVTDTDITGMTRRDPAREKEFFSKIYRLAEHYEQDSFLFTFPGVNRVAFLVATNNAGRSYFRNDAKFAGPLYTDVENLDAWTGCSNDGKIAFMLKGIVLKRVPETRGIVWIGEGDIFDLEHYNPDSLVIIHDGSYEELGNKCSDYHMEVPALKETVLGQDEDIRSIVLRELESLPKKVKTIGFHCSAQHGGSYVEGARAGLEAVLEWAQKQPSRSKQIIIFDIFGDYFKTLE